MATDPILSFADFRVDAPNGRLWRGDEPLAVPPKVLSVLHHLAERPQQLVTKADLFAHVWPETAVGDAVLTVAIGEIRKLLGDDPRTPRFIETVHRRGYRFIAPVANQAAPAATIAPTTPQPAEPQRRAASSNGKMGIVGRDSDLAYLHDLLRRALDGEPQVVFVTGAAGLGKTTLVDAFLEQVAATEKVWIAKGQCLEHYGAGEAFLPVFEALGNLADEVALADFVPLLRRFAPSWLAQMPRLLDADDFSLLLRTTAGIAPERRLREMLDALQELAARAPLLLVLEDLHWSDYSTIDLLAALARRRSTARLLVLGTHRPADLAAEGHPLLPLTQDLLARRQCRELALELLPESAVGSYLAERFRQNGFPSELSALLRERTDGHPLFMVHLVDDWVEGDQLTCMAGSWQVDGSLDRLRSRLPASLRALVEQHASRCTEEEQQLVAAASVVGDEFAVGPIAAALEVDPLDVERGCESLVRRDLLERRSIGRAASGELVSRYGFRHAVYRNVLYESIPVGQRQQWHRRIAQSIERESGERASEAAAELALHFEQGRDERAAVRHLAIAAQNALLRSAHREAIGYLRRGLAAASELPDGSERDQSELVLRVCLGVALSATQGYAASEVEETYTRALELCRSRGGSSELFSTLHGLCRFYGVRADFGIAIEVGDELYRHAEEQGTAALLLEASWAKGTMLVYRGELDAARRLLEQGVSIYAPEKHGSHAFEYGQDPGVTCRGFRS
jgi:predicted ATPase/DNA-binding winged helix-turn-helix (wHTH) protein